MTSNYKILLIDDDPRVLEVISEFLAIHHYHVICSKDGFEGLEIIEKNPHGIDLVITDIRMPYISGIGLIRLLKEKYPQIPVIAITGEGDIAVEGSLAAKVDAVLLKPFQLEKMITIVENLIESRLLEVNRLQNTSVRI